MAATDKLIIFDTSLRDGEQVRYFFFSILKEKKY
jgi:isopropylmalate/homocitrate/citramalate synthase